MAPAGGPRLPHAPGVRLVNPCRALSLAGLRHKGCLGGSTYPLTADLCHGPATRTKAPGPHPAGAFFFGSADSRGSIFPIGRTPVPRSGPDSQTGSVGALPYHWGRANLAPRGSWLADHAQHQYLQAPASPLGPIFLLPVRRRFDRGPSL
jgi:hypothetical protein